MIRVLVADDHPLFRGGVVRAVAEHPQLELVGEAADGRAALAQLRRLEPDVAVLDVRMPEIDGPGVLSAIRAIGLSTRVLFLSAFDDGPLVHGMLAAGAAGFLTKEAEDEELGAAIVRVAAGEVVVAASLQRGILGQIGSAASAPSRLSVREWEVLALVARGLTSRQIAEELFLAPGTVKTYTQRIFEKLGVSDRAAAVAEGVRRGLIE